MAVDREGNIALVTRNKKNFTGKHISTDDFSNHYFSIAKLDKDKNHIWITAVDNFVEHFVIKHRDDRLSISLEMAAHDDKRIPLFFTRQGDLLLALSFYFLETDHILIVKINKDGKALWAIPIKLQTNSRFYPRSLIYKIKEDSNNNIYLVGTVEKYTWGKNNEKTEPVLFGTTEIIPQRELSPFISKLSPQGEFVWTHVFDIGLQTSEIYERIDGGHLQNSSYPFAFDIHPNSPNTMVFAGIIEGDATFPTFPPSSLTGAKDIFVFTADLIAKDTTR